jgi:vacuolar-type H+-ATPase subunit H
MDDHEILKHLLDIEKKASALIDDAQAEADRRTVEGEKQNRLRYDEIYAREAAFLENGYAKNLGDVKEHYRQQLEVYRASLKTMPADREAFSSLAEKYLLASFSISTSIEEK